MLVPVATLVFGTLLLSDPPESAEGDGEGEGTHPGQHHADHPNVVGLRIGYLGVIEPGSEETETRSALFIGLSYERTVIHEWLEVELSTPVAISFDDDPLLSFPIDVHLKKPFHPAPWVSPYVAVGPTFDVTIRPETAVFFGGSFAVGTYIWPSSRVGIDVELDYNIVAEDGRAIHEVLFAAGPVLRF
ncbi:MAG: hypothetical protein AAGA54_29655 [Myxococcota bacterium]